MRARALIAVALIAAGPGFAIAVSATPAQASCTGSPARAADAFNGTVVRLGIDDRQAFVRTDAGSVVEVDGGAAGLDVSSGEDYHFVLGGRYVIDPSNAVEPYLVNDCTATTLLGMTSVPATPTRALVASTALTTRESWWPVLRDAAVILVLTVLALVAIRRRIWRRTRRADVGGPG